MKDKGMKQNVLQEIMDLMDQKDGESLKSHPKFDKKEVTKEEPAEEIDAPGESEESLFGDKKAEEGDEMSAEAEKMEDMSPEDVERLLKHLEDMK